MNNIMIPFNFEGVRLQESCWIDKKPYFTQKAIGEWLEYKNPTKAINNIINRNPYIKTFSVVLRLGTTWGKQKIQKEHEVYDPIGLQLIINRSNQTKAIKFQIAAAKLVYAFITGKLKSLYVPTDIAELMCFKGGDERSAAVNKLAEKRGCSIFAVYGEFRKYRKTQGLPIKTNSKKGTYFNHKEAQKIIDYKKEHPTATSTEIKKNTKTNYSKSSINRILSIIKNN